MDCTVLVLGASLDASVVIGDSGSIIVDMVELHIYHIVLSVPWLAMLNLGEFVMNRVSTFFTEKFFTEKLCLLG